MKNWFILLFVLFPLLTFAQPEKVETEIVGGKKYYVHHVQSGNTLFGIHKLYNVPVEEIMKANPGSEKGLNEGQKILVPVPLMTIVHTVVNKETLFGIAKKYGVTVEMILNANPDAESGIKVGQKLTIPGVERELAIKKDDKTIVREVPVPVVSDTASITVNNVKISFSDTIINHTVLDHETLYSISKRFMVSIEELQKINGLKGAKIKPGDQLKIPVKKEKIEQVKVRAVEPIVKNKVDSTLLFPKKNTYKIAILLPFFLDKGEGSSDPISTLATEFYMGAKLAIDSLESLGLHAQVYVYDSKNDTNTVKKILLKPEFADMDLIFGPLFADNTDIVARWCKLHQVRMICPIPQSPAILKENPFVYHAVPTDVTLLKGLAEYTLQKNSKDQIILIKPSSEKDQLIYESFRNTFLTSPFNGVRPKLIEATVDNFSTFMKKGVKVILIFPTNDKLSAVKFINNLNNVSQKFNSEDISIYGTKEWLNFEDVKMHYKNKYNFHFSSPNDLNYTYDDTEDLHRKYRSAYNADMTKMAVQGFDVVFYFCSEFLMGLPVKKSVMNDFKIIQRGQGNGYENANSFILEQEDFELIKRN